MATYEIVRMYQNGRKSKVQRTGLSLEQAQAWCEDPETSSKTKASLQGKRKQANLDATEGHWFDGYREVR